MPTHGYEIRVAGHLDATILDGLSTAAIDNQENGDALIRATIPDQPTLMRLLLDLNDLGLTLLSVKITRNRRKK